MLTKPTRSEPIDTTDSWYTYSL